MLAEEVFVAACELDKLGETGNLTGVNERLAELRQRYEDLRSYLAEQGVALTG